MSVINKMLRDLDQRNMAPPLDGAAPRTPLPVQGAVSFSAPQPLVSSVLRLGLGAALLSGLGLAGWLAWQQLGSNAPAAAVPVANMATSAVTVTAAASEAMAPQQAVQTAEPLAVAAVATTPTPTPRPGRASEAVAPTANPAVSLRMESSLSARKALNAVLAGASAPALALSATPPVTSAKASAAPTEAPLAAQRQQQASADALLQAQTLWNAGSHAAAIDLLQQSVDAAERAVKAGSSPVGNPAMLSLVRELVRMQMVQSHFQAVWDLLVRLESVLGTQPDLWGLRGNTGQRLGRHQDSVNAYRTALQSRPDEQRWLLGCAVSLAALGQSAQAAEMAERARSAGPISRDVQTYLQQMGVQFKGQ